MKWCGRLLIPLLTTTTAAVAAAGSTSNLRPRGGAVASTTKDLRTLQNRHLAEASGTLNVLVLLMEFTDHAEKSKISQETIENLFMGTERDSSIIPSGSIQQYIQSNSYGNLNIEVTVVDWQTTDNTEYYYADGRGGYPGGAGTVQLEDSVTPLLTNMDTEGFDFSNYDLNKDGVLDLVMVLHSGYAAQYGDQVSCEPYAKKLDRIMDQQLSASSDAWTSADGKYTLGTFVIASSYNGVCNTNSAKVGAVAHELLRTLGLSSLVDSSIPYGGGGEGGIGGFDIMGTKRGFGNRFAWPGHMSGWSKSKIAWVNPIEITTDGVYTARPSELYPDIYKISAGYQNPQEYLLIENRQPILFDEQLSPSGTGGFVVYHIDETSNNVRGYPGQQDADGNTWPLNGNHYQVAVLQRDGLYHLEKGENNGDAGDFYLPDMGYTLGPGNGHTVFPNTDSYSSGVYEETGIIITNFVTVDATNGILSFEVQGLGVAAEPTDPPTMQPMTEAPTTKKPEEKKEEEMTVKPTTQAPTTKEPTMDEEEVEESSVSFETNSTMANTTDVPTTDSPTTEAPTSSPAPTCTGCTRAPTMKPTLAPTKPPTETPDFFSATSSSPSTHDGVAAVTTTIFVGTIFFVGAGMMML